MNRTEFLAALALRLEDLPVDEREEAVKYYSEYLDEVGMDGEDAAIAELGGAEKVSNIIRANCGLGPYRPADKATAKPELTLDSPSYSQAVENTVHSSQAAAQAAQAATARAAQTAQAAQAAQPQKKQPVPPTYTPSNPAGASTANNASTANAASAAAVNAAAASMAAAAQTAASAPQAASAATAASGNPAQSGFTPPAYTSTSGNPFAGQAPDARNVYSAAAAAGAAQDAANATVPPTYGATSAAPPSYPGSQPRYNQNNSRVLWILIIVASSPIWLGLLGGLIGLVFGIFGTFIGLLASGFGMFIAGIVHAAVSIPLFFTSPATALATIGMSLLAASIGAFLGSGMVIACCKVFPLIGKVFTGLFGWVHGKVSGK